MRKLHEIRKKELVNQMEVKLEQINNENTELKVRVETLDTQVKQLEQTNYLLSEENRQLRETLLSLTQCEHPSTDFQTNVPPRSPSTDDSADVDHFFSASVTSDSEETPSSPTNVNDNLVSFDNDPTFVDDALLNDSPFAWNEPSIFNVVTMFAVFLCFGLFFPTISNTTYPVLPEEVIYSKSSNEIPAEVSFFKSKKHLTSRSLLDVGDQPETPTDSFNSSFTCPYVPLSMEDVLLDETNVKSSVPKSYSLQNDEKMIKHDPSTASYRSSYPIYAANASYEKETFVGVSIPYVRVLLVES